jgi:hypothetical protein
MEEDLFAQETRQWPGLIVRILLVHAKSKEEGIVVTSAKRHQ